MKHKLMIAFAAIATTGIVHFIYWKIGVHDFIISILTSNC